MIISTEAVVLNSMKYGDTSKIVSFYTKESGLIKTIAKGSRAAKNKFGSSLEPFSRSYITYYEKSGTELYLLSNAETIEPYRKIIDNYDKITAGLAILGSVSSTQEIHQPNEELFDYITRALSVLNSSDKNFYSVFVSFQTFLAHNLGFSLNFDFAPVSELKEIFFSINSGIITTTKVGSNLFRLSVDKAQYLRNIDQSQLENSIDFSIPEKEQKIINAFFVNYFSFHLDKRFYYNAFS